MCTWEQIAAEVKRTGWEGFPNRQPQQPNGASFNTEWHTSACPIAGGRDRLKIFPYETPRAGPHIWCHACNMWYRIPGVVTSNTRQLAPIAQPKPLDASLALKFHEQLGKHEHFFLSRGITREWISLAKLGWTAECEKKRWRYAIPCFDQAFTLWAMQYRHWKVAYKGDYKYISEAGGSNNRLFIPPYYVLNRLPYVLVDESPLDALTWCSLGIPAIAPFSGGRISKPWLDEWTAWLPEHVVFIAQNDGGFGVDVAVSRYLSVGRGRVIEIEGAKDVSGMIARKMDPVRWLGLPIVSELVEPKRRGQ